MSVPSRVEQCLQEKFPKAEIKVKGDAYHIEATVISPQFKDKSLLHRHRMIYNALGDKLCALVHALTMHTYTPEESERSSNN